MNEIGLFDRGGDGEPTTVADGVDGEEPAADNGGTAAATGGGYEVVAPFGEELRAEDIGYTIVGADARPDVDGMLALSLDVRAASYENPGMNFWDDSFRLRVGDEIYAPSGGLNEVVPGGATGRGTVLFVVPDSTRSAELVIRYPAGERTVDLELRSG